MNKGEDAAARSWTEAGNGLLVSEACNTHFCHSVVLVCGSMLYQVLSCQTTSH